MSIYLNQKKSDLVGIIASSLCAIHCAITPLIFVAKPFLHEAACQSSGCCSNAPIGWKIFDFIFLLISLFAVWYSAKNTDKKSIQWLLWISWIALMIGLLTSRYFGHLLMYIGSFVLVLTHLINFQHCQACHKGNCSSIPHQN